MPGLYPVHANSPPETAERLKNGTLCSEPFLITMARASKNRASPLNVSTIDAF
jgi:hypothetical protein